MLHYIIDGYNIMKQVTRITGKKLSRGRDSFIHLLETEKPQGSLRNKVTVVFDGYPDTYNSRLNSEIEVIFSHDESADDRIIKIVDKLNKKNLVVVTDDNAVKYTVKTQGASIASSKEFLIRMVPKTNLASEQEEKMHPDTKAGIEITKELKKIWLK